MLQAQSPACVGCGGPLGPLDASGHVRCTFCGRDNYVQRRAAPPPALMPPPAPMAPMAPVPPVGKSAHGSASLVAAIVAAIAVLAGAIVAVTVAKQSGGMAASGDGPGSGGVVPPGEHLQWGGTPHTVAPVQINGDGVEDFVGIYQLLEGSQQQMFAGGFDGKTLERKWKSAPLGLGSQNGHTMRLGVAGGRAVVTDTRYAVHVLDVATGKEIGTAQLSDQPRGSCTEGPGGHRVWIEVADARNVLIDVKTAKATVSAERPAFCPSAEGRACESATVVCRDGDAAPNSPGMSASSVFIDGDLAVALGSKTPGTPVPTLQGFDPKTRAVHWTATVAPDPLASSSGTDEPTDLSGGRLYTVYGQTSKGYRLVAFDARTGARTWDVAIPRSESGSGPREIVVTPKRIYVPHWTWLDLFDTATGKHVGTVGMW